MTIEQAVASGGSIAGSLRLLNRAIVGTNYKWIKSEIERFGLNTNHWQKNKNCRNRYYTNEEMFADNSLISTGVVKRRILQDNLLLDECAICKSKSMWIEKPLILILDHENGIRRDHRLSNLRFLCPNCNSQQNTFAGRNMLNPRVRTKKEPRRCRCGKVSRFGRCKSCTQLDRTPKHDWPSIEILCKKIWETSYRNVAKEIGVSDTGVKSYISRKMNLPTNKVSEYIKNMNTKTDS